MSDANERLWASHARDSLAAKALSVFDVLSPPTPSSAVSPRCLTFFGNGNGWSKDRGKRQFAKAVHSVSPAGCSAWNGYCQRMPPGKLEAVQKHAVLALQW